MPEIEIVNGQSFDMCRITHSKRQCNVSIGTMRKYAREGLKLYKVGKALWFSKTELADFIRSHAK